VTETEPEVDQLSGGQMTSSMPNLSFVTSLADIEGDDHVMTSSTRNSTPDCNMTPDAQNNNNDVIYYDEIIKFQQHRESSTLPYMAVALESCSLAPPPKLFLYKEINFILFFSDFSMFASRAIRYEQV